ncbi:MAG TPA: hypothetical protein VKA46_23420 [Gemmataceae bacterium]|nr:hypothetical protein [Gemmataceae bacterium]
MKVFVADTNVLVVANLRTPQAGPACVLACVNALERIQKKGRLVLDEAMLIFEEYQQYCSFSGQPGVGDAFFKWVHDNRYNDRHCERVGLTRSSDTSRDFEEFPADPDLVEFDRSDRKFVAVALASGLSPTVLNAVDSDWWNYQDSLRRNGVKLTFLCPEQFQGE